MTKQKCIKKALISLFVLVFSFSNFCFFAGCQNNGREDENILTFMYLQVSDNQGNDFYLGKDNTTHEKDLEYEYKSDVLIFKTKAFYENGETCLKPPVVNFRQITIHLDEPGVYKLQQIYKDTNDLNIVFTLNITVKENPDTRPVPTIEILPDENCVSYEMNKRYVYRYNGERQRPKYFKAYDPDHPELLIATLDIDGYAVNIEIVEGAETNQNFLDVGIYKFDLSVNAPNYGIGGDGGHYAKARIDDIIIEIIE